MGASCHYDGYYGPYDGRRLHSHCVGSVMIEIVKGKQVVARSRNLRGVLDYARKSYMREVACYMKNGGSALVCFTYDDGAVCRTDFASYIVALRFARTRRSWALTEIYCGPHCTIFTILCGDARY